MLQMHALRSWGLVMARSAAVLIVAGAFLLKPDAAFAGTPPTIPTSPAAPASAAGAPPPELVLYPAGEGSADQRGNYYASLLKLVLAKSDEKLFPQPTPHASGIARAFNRLAQRDGVDVMWAPATQQLDQEFLRIRVPLDKGLLGWRLFLVRSADEQAFAGVRTVEQLGTRSAGQVAEWLDTDILGINGLAVVKAMRYQDLFNMLAAKRFDYLPRGIAEIRAEAATHARLGLQIEPSLALHYPMCSYFYVARSNTWLAKQLETGLRRAQKDGSFERLFQQFNQAAIQAAGLKKRAVLELQNPYAPQNAEADQDECAAASKTLRSAK
ncbi:hypothetical protein ACFJGW_12570 [Burkholderiaceae bacterium UC74_6]